ncbi:YwpF family protein [Bacillus sp. 2205SS5-2]|uniref:YwpF family protein n=1 Tax=Bacillus sp. 2205SS5-2 TaxID=3109031 RepID=UPI00300725B4
MKTFKIITFQIIDQEEIVTIDIEDGLIINKEDLKGTWLVEAFASRQYYDYFREIQQTTDDTEIRVVITHPQNDYASFFIHIRGIKQLDGKISVLMEGHLKKIPKDYSELLLNELIEQGLEGAPLIETFRKKIKLKPKLTSNSSGQ